MASPRGTPGGVKASSSETFDRGVDVSRSTGGEIGAALKVESSPGHKLSCRAARLRSLRFPPIGGKQQSEATKPEVPRPKLRLVEVEINKRSKT